MIVKICLIIVGIFALSPVLAQQQDIQYKIYNSGIFSVECYSGKKTTTNPPGGDQIFNVPIEQRIICPPSCLSSNTMASGGRQQNIKKCT